MGTAVQILESFFSSPFLLEAHTGCQIEDMQQERAQLTVEGDETYTVS